jgi:DNA (cytosine-5)-methyltransferase 1
MDNVAIKEKRMQLGLTQKEFSDALGLGKNGERTLRRWENGETNPSLIELHFIMDFAKSIPYPNPSKEKANFTFIDLFAGIGGIRLPFTRLGGYCKFTSEWDKFAQKTYKTNYGDMPAGDITQIPNEKIPDFDILLAGFPCQPFSAAGLKKGFSDTRGTLFFEIERIIEGKRPKVFLLENVKQLKGHDKGHTFKVIIEHLKALDYDVRSTILRAADFGVPQNRERLFIIGFDNKQLKPGQTIDFKFPIPPKTPTKVGNILEQNVDSKYTISNKLYAGHLRRKQEHLQKGNGFGFSVFNADSTYTNTISARYYKDGSEILIDQGPNKNPRKLTPRECARLQGFPDDFIIPVSDMQSYKQFGNSVSVPVVQAVANNIIAELKRLQWI